MPTESEVSPLLKQLAFTVGGTEAVLAAILLSSQGGEALAKLRADLAATDGAARLSPQLDDWRERAGALAVRLEGAINGTAAVVAAAAALIQADVGGENPDSYWSNLEAAVKNLRALRRAYEREASVGHD